MTPITPGLSILHGNRMEVLRDIVFEWTAQHPLAPLEEEIFLVPSNGIAEWLKMALAAHHGVCAATRVELPARFLWRAWRDVLGDALPLRARTDKDALTWRLLSLLPAQLGDPAFEPLARFLGDGQWTRRYQLAARLADLYDQYQVYRPDWLAAWAIGRSVLLQQDGSETVLPLDQQWQQLLWRSLVSSLGEEAHAETRPALHERFLEVLSAERAHFERLPRRIVLFGLSSIPPTTLQSLVALARYSQVLLAIPNPCRFHWADTIDGRELMRAQRRRLPLRGERDLASVAPEALHLHAHPLLAAWGRQGRDFMSQLEHYDDVASTLERTGLPRIDFFDEGEAETLLGQIQTRIRDLVPLIEQPGSRLTPGDRSVVFHVAHGPQREVEILHDQLLALLADRSNSLAPRDIVVMVPDIEIFAPAIRAVFGQYARHDPRFIPFGIADQQQRHADPLVVAVEWLLGLPHQRCTGSELRALLDVPAVTARFGISEPDRPMLARWIAESGIRWGLDDQHRAVLGLESCGSQNSWQFGLDRMLLGYASGRVKDSVGATHFADIEPLGQVGGLGAAIVGAFAALLEALQRFSRIASSPARPAEWAVRLRSLLSEFFSAETETDRATLARLTSSLDDWLEICDAATFEEEVPLSVVRDAWLSAIDEPSLGRRFAGGGVTFCTLMPMRAIPFEVVCLLGMNDGDYPRRTHRTDFDLMAMPGQRRAGDRSRREDDRYLMLEALLSARRQLYVSWAGRSVHNNSEQPPSVLVSQLRDYIAAAWGSDWLLRLTTEHPLQPFSRRYFEGATSGSQVGLFTYAREWRHAHEPAAPGAFTEAKSTPAVAENTRTATLQSLTRLLKNPAQSYFRERLRVDFAELAPAAPDEEALEVGGLEGWALRNELLREADKPALVIAAERQRRSGALPLAAFGVRHRDELLTAVSPMLASWQDVCTRFPQPVDPIVLNLSSASGDFNDRLEGLRTDGVTHVRVERTASTLNFKALAPDKFAGAWVAALAAAKAGREISTIVIGLEGSVTLPTVGAETASQAWEELLALWVQGLAKPIPVPCKTGAQWLRDQKGAAASYEGGFERSGERDDPCLGRLWPDFQALMADGFESLAPRMWSACLQWLDQGRLETHPGIEGAENG